ncbi:acetyl-CoA carboxylase biotin carboxylase subunit [Actinomadura sp. KC06]|uniref:acetyl-CoA carboxylase biotin carboxylase subunit n=1 Tax=Actinomadura sp. KC06 TaxID=2530369 RepID=UPI00104D590D|nr:acetyl-CoA carboxylase biotin carboxylase subunit [Actinomadura sp. KC06]TDD34234.1 acetyl-CoA carboxylase biotin carboxylase subunit [Actinomadura sp. KC06]
MQMLDIGPVLVANRGEIAVRVIRALRELGIPSVAVHSDADAGALHVRSADRSYGLGPAAPAQSYLDIERVLRAAEVTGARSIHPGYGFLAENPVFAEACERAGLIFIGPPVEAIRGMGSKIEARRRMRDAGIPTVPGGTDPLATAHDAAAAADAIGYPVAFKASAGGGGRGFRVAADRSAVEQAFTGAQGEGLRFFGDPSVYVERYIEDPRHVEVQIFADAHGNVVHLGERDCSVQRRHQKLIEESPGPTVDPALRERIGEIAVAAARSIGYRSAGTVEGLLVGDDFYFLEMNTRLQVEHPVTEMVTGVDLVREQLRVAAGLPLAFAQGDVRMRGWAIECRINAESAAKGFLPAPGTITTWVPPDGPGVRVDSGVRAGDQITTHYDPLLAKLIVWDTDRGAATRRMLRALDEFEVAGTATLIPFHRNFLRTPEWERGETGRSLLADRTWLKATAETAPDRHATGTKQEIS